MVNFAIQLHLAYSTAPSSIKPALRTATISSATRGLTNPSFLAVRRPGAPQRLRPAWTPCQIWLVIDKVSKAPEN